MSMVEEIGRIEEGAHGRFVPLYFRIVDNIISRIRAGDLRPGDRVPSENEIRALHKVSSSTARKALDELANGGWVRRRKGKGSFVAGPVMHGNVTQIISFRAQMTKMGLRPSAQVLSQEVCTEQEREVELVVAGCKHVLKAPYLRIERLRLGEGSPIMLETRFISLDLCPGMESKDLAESLFSLTEEVYGCTRLRALQSISPALIDGEAARHLGCSDGQLGFLIETIVYTVNDRLLELGSALYRGDRYRIFIEAKR